MNLVRGPWTETGANFNPNLTIVREEVRDFIASEVHLCAVAGVQVAEPEVDLIEQGLWNRGLLEPGAHVTIAYPQLLEEAAGDNLDPYYYTAA